MRQTQVRLRKLILLALLVVGTQPALASAEGDIVPTLNPLGALLFKDLHLVASWEYGNTGTYSDPVSGPRVPLTFKPQTTSQFGMTINKPVFAQFFDHMEWGNHSAPYWDLLIQPVKVKGQVTYGEILALRPESNVRADITTKTTYSIGVAYDVDISLIMRYLPWFNSSAR
jgi:hypothetical protein